VRAVVLGAGGSARAAAMALSGRAESVDVINRDAGKARTLSLQLRAAGTRSASAALGTDSARDLLSRAQLVVHCTTIGMNTNETLIDVAQLDATCALCDLVYAGANGTKPGETALVAAARARGLAVIDGIDVLVHQAIESLAIWLHRDSLTQLFPALRAAALAATPHAEV
jgi:shikimate dehydrogenase